jgi:hypothetical protein
MVKLQVVKSQMTSAAFISVWEGNVSDPNFAFLDERLGWTKRLSYHRLSVVFLLYANDNQCFREKQTQIHSPINRRYLPWTSSCCCSFRAPHFLTARLLCLLCLLCWTMASRGPNWTQAEHLLLCKAFVAASEDPVVGTDQKGNDFQDKMHEAYKQLLENYNSDNGTRYSERKSSSNFNHFKKFSKYMLKYVGIEQSAGDPPSGDSDREEWLQGCKDTFCERYPEGKNLLDSLLYCQEFLQESPKWEAFERKKEENKKRPVGTKKTKQENSDVQ